MEESQETNIQVSKKQPKFILIGIVVIAVVLLGIGLFMNIRKTDNSGSDMVLSENADSGQPENPVSEEMEGSDAEETDVVTIRMEAGSFYYAPSEIRVSAGDKVKIELTSVDMMHDFNIDELNVKSPVTLAGETSVIEFIAEEPGEYEYYCSVGNHRAMGQVGTLIVE